MGDYKFELVWIDSQSDPAKVTSAYAEACERIGTQAGVIKSNPSRGRLQQLSAGTPSSKRGRRR